MGIFEEQVLSRSIESFVGHLTSCGTCWKVSGGQDQAPGLRGRYGEIHLKLKFAAKDGRSRCPH